MADVGDEAQVKTKKKAYELENERDVAELYSILQKPAGRAVVWRVLSECGLYASAFGDANEVFRAEGKRDIGLWLVKEVFTSDPKAYSIMRNEADQRVSASELSQKGKNDG